METDKILKAIERKNRIEQGYFDGRFKQKIIKNKKKEKEKYKAREKVISSFCFNNNLSNWGKISYFC